MTKSLYFFYILVFCSLSLKGQVSVTATAGTPSGNYPNLYTAFDAINYGEYQGAITILINASITETMPARLNAGNGLSHYTTIKIMPTVACTINGNIKGALIDLNGADSVIIDGRINGQGTTRSLTLQNFYSAYDNDISTILFRNGASFNTVQFTNIQGSGQGDIVGNIIIGGSENIEGNSNNIIDNNNIGPADPTKPNAAGIRADSENSRSINYNNTISNNLIHDFYSDEPPPAYGSAGIEIFTGNNRYIITGNSVYQTLPVTGNLLSTHTYIRIFGDENIVANNYIGGSTYKAGGAPAIYNGNISIIGILIIGTSKNPNIVDGNIITNFDITNPNQIGNRGYFTGIVTGGYCNIGLGKGNIIGSLTKSGAITVHYTGSSDNLCGISGINCSGGFLDIPCSIENNTIGSLTVEGNNTTNTFISGISISNMIGCIIRNNVIGGPAAGSLNNNSAAGSITGINLTYNRDKSQYTCTNNIIQDLYNNSTGILDASVTGIGAQLNPNMDGTVTNIISDNQLVNLKTTYTTAVNASIKAIAIDPPSTTTGSVINNRITGNHINNLSSASTSFYTVVAGISNECPYNEFMNIDSNIIHTLTNAATNISLFASASVQGIIALSPSAAPASISSNEIYNLESNSTAATSVAGISCFHGSDSNTFTLSKNLIYDLKNETSGQGFVTGIHLKGVGDTGTFCVANNMITLTTSKAKLYGILNSASATSLELYYNSVHVGGTALTGNISGAFSRTSLTNTSIKSLNNIFSNSRTGGSANQYALINENIVPETNWSLSNFNNLFSNDTATIALWGNTSMGFENYVNHAQQDSCSKSIHTDFADVTNGNLHLLNTENNKGLEGISITSVTDDFDGDQRHANPAIGADEILTAFQPPAITALDTTTFCEGGSVVLKSSAISNNQWYKDDTLIIGATAQTYEATQTGVYFVILTNGCITAKSGSINITAKPIPATPVITQTGDTLNSSATLGNQWFISEILINGATDQQFIPDTNGLYTVAVTENGCPAVSVPYNFRKCSQWTFDTVVTHINCYGENTGSVGIIISGGTSPYNYSWSNGATTKNLNNSSAGSYTLQAMDAVGCKDSITVTLTQPEVLDISETHKNISCTQGQDSLGSINLTVNGGIAPYRYDWSNGASSEDISGLAEGKYSVVVSDANNCSKEIEIIISSAPSDCFTGKFIAYPNPTPGVLKIKVADQAEKVSFAVYDIYGKMKLQKEVTANNTGIIELNILHLDPAVYFIKIATSKEVVTRRILKIN